MYANLLSCRGPGIGRGNLLICPFDLFPFALCSYVLLPFSFILLPCALLSSRPSEATAAIFIIFPLTFYLFLLSSYLLIFLSSYLLIFLSSYPPILLSSPRHPDRGAAERRDLFEYPPEVPPQFNTKHSTLKTQN